MTTPLKNTTSTNYLICKQSPRRHWDCTHRLHCCYLVVLPKHAPRVDIPSQKVPSCSWMLGPCIGILNFGRIFKHKLDFYGKKFHYIPFGSGRRICAGLHLGERMLMYTLASFLHMFHWEVPIGQKPDTTEKFGIVLEKSTPLIAIPTPRLNNLELYSSL